MNIINKWKIKNQYDNKREKKNYIIYTYVEGKFKYIKMNKLSGTNPAYHNSNYVF